MLVPEGMLEIVEGIELIKCNEIVYSGHRGCLIYLNLEDCFDKEFNQANEKEQRLLNPNKISHKKTFVDDC